MVLVLVLDAVSSSTSTSTANAEYEYEKPGKTSIETPKHANSATPLPLATGSTIVRASGRISSCSVEAGDKKKAACVQAAFEGLDLKVWI